MCILIFFFWFLVFLFVCFNSVACFNSSIVPLQGKIWLIDFNPFGEVTDSLLFTWEELTSGKNLKGDQSEGEATEQVQPCSEGGWLTNPTGIMAFYFFFFCYNQIVMQIPLK